MSKSFSLRDRAKKVDYTYKVSEEPLYRQDDSPYASPKKSKPKRLSSADKKSPKRKSSAITAETSPSYEESDEEDKPVRKIMKKVDNPVYVFNGKSLSEFSLTTDNDQPSTQPSTSSLKERSQPAAVSRPSTASTKSKVSLGKKDTAKASTKTVVDKADKPMSTSTSVPAKPAAKTSKASASNSMIPESDIEMKAFARTLLAQHPGFRMFATEERRDIVASLPDPSTEAVMRECCRRWLALTDKQRMDMDEDSGNLDTPMSWKTKDTATIAASMGAATTAAASGRPGTGMGTGMGVARDMSDADATIDDLDMGTASMMTAASRGAGTGPSTTGTGSRTASMGTSVSAAGGRARATSTGTGTGARASSVGKGAAGMGVDEIKDSRTRGASAGKDRGDVGVAREEKSDREIVTNVVPVNATNASTMAKKTTTSTSRVTKPAVATATTTAASKTATAAAAPATVPAESWDVHDAMDDFDNSETAEDWGFTTRKSSKSSEKSKSGVPAAPAATSTTSRTRTTDAPRMGVRPVPREPLPRENAVAPTVTRAQEPVPVNVLHARPRPISPVRAQPAPATGTGTVRGRDTSPVASHHGTRAPAQVREGRVASTSPARAQVPLPTNTQSSRAAATSVTHPDVRDLTRAPVPVPVSSYHVGGADEVLQLYDQQGRPVTYIRAPPVSPRRNMPAGYFSDVPGYPGVLPRPFPEHPLRVAPPSPSYPRPVGPYAATENTEYVHARQHGSGVTGVSHPAPGPGISSSGNIVDTPRTIRMNELLTHADSELVSLHRKLAIPTNPSSPVRKTPALGNSEADFSDMVPDHDALNYYYNSYVRLHTQYDTLKQKYIGIQSDFEDVKAELQHVRSDFEKLDRTRVMLQQERDSAVREATSIKQEMSQLREDLEHQRVTAETALKTPAKERETLQQRILASDAARDELRKKLGELERLLLREKEDKEKVISRGQEEREAMRVRMLQLETQIETQKREMSEELFSERRRCSEAEIRIRETESYYTDRLREMDDSYNTLYDAHNAFEQDVARALVAYRTLCGVDMIQNAQKENLYRCEARGTRFQREIIFDLEFLDDNSEIRYTPRDIRVMDIPVPNFLHDTINFDSKQAPLFLKNLTTVLTDVPKPPLMPQTHMGMAPNMGVHMGAGGMSGGPVQAPVTSMGVNNGMTPHPTAMPMMAPVSAPQMHMNNNPYGMMPGQPMTEQQQRQAYFAAMHTQQAAQAQRQNEQPQVQKQSSKGRKK